MLMITVFANEPYNKIAEKDVNYNTVEAYRTCDEDSLKKDYWTEKNHLKDKMMPLLLKNKLLNDATEIDSLYGKKSNEIKKRVKMASKDDVANDDTIEIDVKPMAASTTEEDELDWLDEQI